MHRTMRTFAAFGLAFALLEGGCTCTDVNVGASGPEGSVAPGLLEFGKIEVGTTKVLTLDVGNTGGSQLTVKDVTMTGDLGDWFVASPHELKVSTVGSREIQVTFTPLYEASAAATMTLTTDSDKTPSLTVQLTGEGFLPKVAVAPTNVDFGNVIVDTSESAQVTVSNGGTDPAAVRVLPLTGQSTEHFRMSLPNATADGVFMLEGGESADIDVTYAPTVSGRHLAAFTVEPCEVCQPVNVTLQGIGLESGLVVEPASIDFGAVNPGASVSKQISFKNIGNRQVQITRAEVQSLAQGQLPDAAFSVDTSGLPIILDEGAVATLDVSFSPGDIQNHTAQIGWTSTDPKNPEGKIVVVGHGGGPDIDVVPARLDFGPVAVGAPFDRQVVVANVGFDDLHVSKIEIRGSTSFVVTQAPTDLTIPIGGTRQITLEYAPTAAQDDAGELVITSDDSDEPEAISELHGTGVELPPCVYEVSPPALKFGLTERNKKKSLQFGITNPEGAAGACLVSGLQLTPDTAPEFTLPDGPVDGLMLQPGETHLVTVDFQPTRTGSYDGAVEFYVSDPNSPHVEVPLRGTAGQAQVMIAPDDLDFGVVKVGCSTRDREFCVYNTGTTSITLTDLQLVEAGTGGEFFFKNIPPGLGTASGVSIPSGAQVCFTVAYKAKNLGTDSAAIYVTLAQYTDPFLIMVTGTGATDAIQTDTFVQLDQPQADILFVIDNSGSMSDNQENLAANFGSFIQFAVNQAIDYHIAATSTDCTTNTNPDVGTPNVPGLFWPQPEPPVRPRIVSPDLPDPEATFRANVLMKEHGDSGRESGLEAAYDALSDPLINDPTKNGGFLRSDAALALIFVSDEEDQSKNLPDFYLNFFLNIRGFRRQNLFSASAIVEGPGCGSGSGLRYIDLQQRTGGVFESICTNDWSRALENLSLVAFGYKTRFFLNNTPMADDITVQIRKPNGSSYDATAWSYNVDANAIDFDPFAIPEPGDTIEITYHVQCL